ncbi:MAG: 2-hydroxychromene-2-carboxylate isomerase [Betaproteobacteria bacterium]|nr:2-hydroxychromene-2-carboxylate isomerase [Betaproteobacteria bacterium]
MAKIVEYFIAPQSPWAYMGHERFMAILKRHHAQVALKPTDMVKVFAASGGVPVAQRPAQRQAYRLAELERWSKFLQMPLNLHPAFFPVAGDPGSKLIIAALHQNGVDSAMALLGALGRACWAEEKNIADADTLIAVANAVGLNGQELLNHAASQAVADELQRNTDDAIAAQVFGVPWYRVEGEGYWGQDRLDFVERMLQNN